MLRTVSTRDEREEEDDLRREGMRSGQRGSSNSKHSEAEQRRRSKINENGVIDQPQLPKKDSTDDSSIFLNPEISMNAQKLESELSGSTAYKTTDRGSVAQAVSFDMPMQPMLFDSRSVQPHMESCHDNARLASYSQSHPWECQPLSPDRTIPCCSPNELEGLKSQCEEANISKIYSAELLNNITHALRSSGVDLSQDICKGISNRAASASFGTKLLFWDIQNYHMTPRPGNQLVTCCELGSNGEDSDGARKRLLLE